MLIREAASQRIVFAQNLQEPAQLVLISVLVLSFKLHTFRA